MRNELDLDVMAKKNFGRGKDLKWKTDMYQNIRIS